MCMGVWRQLLSYVVAKGRYAVRQLNVAASENKSQRPLSLRAASLQLAKGTVVEARNCGPLSGHRGVVVGWDATEVALRVQVEGLCQAFDSSPDANDKTDSVVSLECQNCRALAAGQQIDVAAATESN